MPKKGIQNCDMNWGGGSLVNQRGHGLISSGEGPQASNILTRWFTHPPVGNWWPLPNGGP